MTTVTETMTARETLQLWINGEAPDAATIDTFIEENNFPIVESGSVTYVFHGEADGVNLRHFVFGLPSTQPLHRVPNSDLWHLTLDLPDNSRMEYKFELLMQGQGQWIEDPLNPHRALDPFGANSVLQSFGYEHPDWTEPDPEAREGTLEELRFRSRSLHHDYAVTLYKPARFRKTRQYPLLIVLDGGDYMRFSKMKTVLDNLIHRLEVSEMLVAFTHPRDRLREYAAMPEHDEFLAEELLPRLESRYPLIGTAEGRGLMGASFGAIASFSTALRYPDMFGRLLLQSGSFAFTDIGEQQRGPAFEPVVEFVNKYRANPVPLAERVFVSCGRYESLIYENRSMVPLLQSTGMDVRYVESRDGHNWENWRDRMRDGLSFLFPGPLWMVYE